MSEVKEQAQSLVRGIYTGAIQTVRKLLEA